MDVLKGFTCFQCIAFQGLPAFSSSPKPTNWFQIIAR
jgi:hypothetical protein